jgi:hypothetical protein
MLGSGARIPLRFDHAVKVRGCTRGAGGLGLFPGAMAAFKGKNGGAGIFLVTQILTVSFFEPRVHTLSTPGYRFLHFLPALALTRRNRFRWWQSVGHTPPIRLSILNHGIISFRFLSLENLLWSCL